MKAIVGMVWWLAAGSCSVVWAQQPQQRIAGIYSNLYYNEEGGDLLGMELLIIPKSSGYVACVQVAEGGSPDVVVVPVSIRGASIEFTMPRNSPYSGAHLSGTITSSGIVLHWPQGDKEVLPRSKSYWQ